MATQVKSDDETTSPSVERGAKRIELFSVLLIALTAVLAAWSGFEASKWGGVMSIEFSAAGAARTESVRASNLASQQIVVDVGLFTAFADATAADDDELATFYRDRMPDRLSVAVEAWVATDPVESADAPASPFDMKEYRLVAQEEAERLETAAEQHAQDARQANQRGDNYTLTAVFLASVILLAALSTKVESRRLQLQLLSIASVVFLTTLVVVATFPVEV